MVVFYLSIFAVLVVFSAFFSSAETSLLSLNQIKLNLNAKKKKRKAILLKRILGKPEEFFSTILIGNNFVNIAAASISTLLFTKLLEGDEQLVLLVSTLVTTIVILLFSEIIPKSYAFRYSEKLSYFYAYPIRFFGYLFYPFVKITSWISGLLFKEKSAPHEKDLTIEEIKHFLSSQRKLYQYNPESLRILHEIIDIAEKDIKTIMTPRLNIVGLDQNAGIEDVKKIILEKDISKIPVYDGNLDNITGIVYARDLLMQMLQKDFKRLRMKDIVRTPIHISEYSSLNYAFKQFKQHNITMAVIIDEYGSTIGLLTLHDLFKQIMGEIKVGDEAIRQIKPGTYGIKGNVSVEEVMEKLHVDFPEKPDYTTMSGLFIYHYGKFPRENARIRIGDTVLVVKRMGKRKIDEIILLMDQS